MLHRDTEGFYHTLEELINHKVVVSDLIHKLAGLRRSDVLVWVAGLSAFLQQRGSLSRQQQSELLPALLPHELCNQIQLALKSRNDPAACFFHRRQLWFVLQMALLACKENTAVLPPDETRKAFGLCCMMANDLLKQVELAQCHDAPETPNDAESLSYLIGVLVAFVEISYGAEIFARAQLLWLEIPEAPEMKSHAKRLGLEKTLDEAFDDAYGLPLRGFLFLATVAYYRFEQSSSDDPPSPLMFDSRLFFRRTANAAQVKKALVLISRTADELAAQLLGTSRQTWATDLTPLAQSPLIQIEKDRYVCPDLHFFRSYFVHELYGLVAKACTGVEFKQLFGSIFERYIERVIGGCAVEGPWLARTFYHPVTFDGERNDEVCDGLFSWPSLTVLMEYKSGMLTKRQRHVTSADDTIMGIEEK